MKSFYIASFGASYSFAHHMLISINDSVTFLYIAKKKNHPAIVSIFHPHIPSEVSKTVPLSTHLPSDAQNLKTAPTRGACACGFTIRDNDERDRGASNVATNAKFIQESNPYLGGGEAL